MLVEGRDALARYCRTAMKLDSVRRRLARETDERADARAPLRRALRQSIPQRRLAEDVPPRVWGLASFELHHQ